MTTKGTNFLRLRRSAYRAYRRAGGLGSNLRTSVFFCGHTLNLLADDFDEDAFSAEAVAHAALAQAIFDLRRDVEEVRRSGNSLIF